MSEKAYWLAWSQLPSVGPTLLKRLHQHFGKLSLAWQASPAELRAVEGFGKATIEKFQPKRSQLNPLQLLEQHLIKNPQFWTPDDPQYPQLLLETASPPPLLYYRGQVNEAENQSITPSVAIVGTRRPTDYGKRWTRKISIALAQKGITIISGLAEGIDTEAHRACLDVQGRTIAVLGTGVDIVYPAKNKSLYNQILQQGLILSEYPSGTQPDRSHFPRRNRIIAGFSRATLVLEAPTTSGALITARYANEFGREIYALPGSLDQPNSLGCLELIHNGAQMILSEEQLLETLGCLPNLDPIPPKNPLLSVSPSSPSPSPLNLSPELKQIWQAVKLEATPLDIIIQDSGFDSATVLSALLQLELSGLVSQLPGMFYQRLHL